MLASEFRYSFRQGIPQNVIHTPFFSLRYRKNQSSLACAIVISKRVDTRATVRNKLKRKIMMILESLLTPQNYPYDLVFYVKKQSVGASNDVLKQQIQTTLAKI